MKLERFHTSTDEMIEEGNRLEKNVEYAEGRVSAARKDLAEAYARLEGLKRYDDKGNVTATYERCLAQIEIFHKQLEVAIEVKEEAEIRLSENEAKREALLYEISVYEKGEKRNYETYRRLGEYKYAGNANVALRKTVEKAKRANDDANRLRQSLGKMTEYLSMCDDMMENRVYEPIGCTESIRLNTVHMVGKNEHIYKKKHVVKKRITSKKNTSVLLCEAYSHLVLRAYPKGKEAIKKILAPDHIKLFNCINDCLRNDKEWRLDSESKEFISVIRKTLSKAEMPKKITVYRGVDQNVLKLLNNLPEFRWKNRIIEEKGFLTAYLSSDATMLEMSPVVFEINVPEGSNGLCVQCMTEYMEEKSVAVFDTGVYLKIKEVKREGESLNSKIIIVMDLEPSFESVNRMQKKAISDGMRRLNNGETLTKDEKGNLVEMLMDQFFIKLGYRPLNRLRVKSLSDEKAGFRQGIDGVYELSLPDGKKGYVVADAKYDKSPLNSKTKQMSDNWIKDRLYQNLDKEVADEILVESIINPSSIGRLEHQAGLSRQ